MDDTTSRHDNIPDETTAIIESTEKDSETRVMPAPPEDTPQTPHTRRRFGWTWILTLVFIAVAVSGIIYTVGFRNDELLTSKEYEDAKLEAARPLAQAQYIEVREEPNSADIYDSDTVVVEEPEDVMEADSIIASPLVETEIPATASSDGTPIDMGVVENAPYFPGGDDAMHTWLNTNKNVTEEAGHGKVTVSFIVEKDGSLTDIRVTRGRNAVLDSEAVRLIKSMPAWIAGSDNGSNVRVRYTLPIPL